MKYIQSIDPLNKIALDKKDKKILSILGNDARTSYTKIGKLVNLSKDSVKYRIVKFKKAGIIQGYRTIVNLSALNYENYHLFLQIDPLPWDEEKIIVERWKKYNFCRAILKFSGRFDYEFAIIAKNAAQFEQYLDKILSDANLRIRDYEILHVMDYYVAHTFPRSFLPAPLIEPFRQTQKKYVCDIIDKEIIYYLANQGDIKYYKLAQKVGVTIDIIKYRIKKLKAAGIIVKTIPIVNFNALNYSIFAVLLRFNEVMSNKDSLLKEFLTTNENMLWAVRTLGKYNFIGYICVQNVDAYHKTIIELKDTFSKSIVQIEPLISYEEHKYTYAPKVILEEKESTKN